MWHQSLHSSFRHDNLRHDGRPIGMRLIATWLLTEHDGSDSGSDVDSDADTEANIDAVKRAADPASGEEMFAVGLWEV